jgi:hypothetical protein
MTALKLYLDGEIHTIQAAPPHISALRLLVRQYFNLEETTFQYYDDDEDLITVETQAEYQEALNFLLKRSLRLAVVKKEQAGKTMQGTHTTPCDALKTDYLDLGQLEYKAGPSLLQSSLSEDYLQSSSEVDQSIVIANLFTDGRLSPHLASPAYQELVASVCQTIKEELRALHKDSRQQSSVEYPVECSSCRQAPLVGICFMCAFCDHLFLCKACEALTSHPHPFMKLKKLQDYTEALQMCRLYTLSERRQDKSDNMQTICQKLTSLGACLARWLILVGLEVDSGLGSEDLECLREV